MNGAEKSLVKTLRPMLLATGFEWVRSREYFIRRTPYGFCSLLWTSYPTLEGGEGYVLGPIIGVRHDAVEDLVNRLGLIYGDDNKRYTKTVSRVLKFFPINKNRPYIQKIRRSSIEEDAKRVADNFFEIVTQEGEQFFEKYSSLLECSKGLNTPIEVASHPLFNNFPLRAYRGIAAASFCERDRVPTLVQDYLKYAKTSYSSQYDTISKRIGQLISFAGMEVDL